MHKNESNKLRSGVFWVITDSGDINDYMLLVFEIPCDPYGNIIGTQKIPLNSKSKKKKTYNHKKLWESEVQDKAIHKPYGKQEYSHFPRGRVEISNNRATIYLNPLINIEKIINEVKIRFGLTKQNISDVRIHSDGSRHYKCFIDMNINEDVARYNTELK
jgi:hypothetical protein